MNATKRSILIVLISLICLCAGCSEVGITGRKQLNLMPASVMNSMSVQQYGQFMSQSKISTDAGDRAMVQRVGERIRKAVDTYSKKNLPEDPFAGAEWEFSLVDDPAVNAFAMPGGKVVVYTGLLPVAQNDAGLAVVMGHEIAHVFAKHGAERMTQGLLVQMGSIAISEALKEKPEETKALFSTSYGLATQLGVLLPFSRTHENEADRLGLIFMAMAGYDPNLAAPFWERMSALKQGKPQPPEFLSTHPADATRIKNLRDLVPEALDYAKRM